MHLVSTLASGVAVAAVGTAVLNQRGTATPATYYKDFEATQAYVAQPIALDSSGSAVLYVNELVDVLVYDATGVLVREFVAGDAAPAVEVISQSFLGTSYEDGSAGAGKPTTLQHVLDLVLASFGSTDFFVVPTGGSRITLSAATAALQGLFFNVKTYGAIGNGVADDGAAIAAAVSAAQLASSTGNATVFFPSGVYRVTAQITWPQGIKMLGSGGRGSKIAADNAALAILVNYQAGPQTTVVEGMWFGALTAMPGKLGVVSTAGILHFTDCTFGADLNTTGVHFRVDGAGASARTVFSSCYFQALAGVVDIVQQFVSNRAIFHDCDFVNSQATGINHFNGIGGASFEACRFDSSTVTAGGTRYIQFAPDATMGTVTARGCYFADNATVPPVCLFNSLATPDFDCMESDNTFGSVPGVPITRILPYGYTTDGYAPFSSSLGSAHLSRAGYTEYVNSAGAAFTANPKACGRTIINKTAGAALALSINNGTLGDIWLVEVNNSSGGLLTVTPTGNILLDALAANFTVANGAKRFLQFAWMTLGTGATPGRWSQIAPSTTA